MSSGASEITIQPVADQDFDLADEFAARVWAYYHQEEGHDPNVDWSSRPVALVAKRDAEIVGLARGRVRAGVGHLSELLVEPGSRTRGIGSALLAEFESRCRQSGCHKLTVHTEAEGPARLYYEARGWTHEAIHRRDRAGLDFVRLVKFLDG